MIDSRNVCILSGRLTADAEIIEPKPGLKIIKFRLAADFAGTENGKSASGYFDITHFVIPDGQASKFLEKQIAEGNITKGTAVSVLGRLSHERWETDKGKGQRVSIVAESVNFVGGGTKTTSGDPADAAAATADTEPAAVPAKW